MAARGGVPDDFGSRGRLQGPLDTVFASYPTHECTKAVSDILDSNQIRVDAPADTEDVKTPNLSELSRWMIRRLLVADNQPVILTGPPGSGKSTMLRNIHDRVHERTLSVNGVQKQWVVAAMAPTHPACHVLRSSGLKTVITLAAFCQRTMPTIDAHGNTMAHSVEKQASLAAKRLASTKISELKELVPAMREGRALLFVDEAWMVSEDDIMVLNLMLQLFMQRTALFGGIPVIISGDPRQMEPVSTHERPTRPFFYAKFFTPRLYAVYVLRTLHRCKDPDLAYLLECMYTGNIPPDALRMLESVRTGPGRRRQPPADAIHIKTRHFDRELHTIKTLQQMEASGNYELHRILTCVGVDHETPMSDTIRTMLGAEVLVLATPLRPDTPGQLLRITGNALRHSTPPLTNNMLVRLVRLIFVNGQPAIWVRPINTDTEVLIGAVATVVRTNVAETIKRRAKELRGKQSPAYVTKMPEFQDKTVVAVSYRLPVESASSLTAESMQGITLPKGTGICFSLEDIRKPAVVLMLASRVERLADIYTLGQIERTYNMCGVKGIIPSRYTKDTQKFIANGVRIN